jgi:queuine tRNA-ribosyltransferase
VKLHIDIEATCGEARAGRVHTARGSFETPIFMPVGTRGAVRAMTSAEMDRLGTEVILGNTYHLMLRPGSEVVETLGGLGEFMGWPHHTLTDSGGFQVFSLGPKLTDDGATFRSTYDGSTVHLTPEDAVRIQEQLGADIQMVLDVCAPLPSDHRVLADAVRRTADWAARARTTFRRVDDQSLFGIVQGGDDEALRRESAQRTVELDFDGYAVGGLSVGESRHEMLPALHAALEHLPADQPRYFMGLGDPIGMIEAVSLGVDMMDCVMPTRFGRHGTMITSEGRFNIKRSEFARSSDPIDPNCPCEVCATYPRGYLRHLVATGEPTAPVLCTIHNLAWMFGFVDRIRASIRSGDLDRLRLETSEVWG